MKADIVILGGGPAGATAARLLARTGRRSVLIEKRVQFHQRWGEVVPPQFREPIASVDLWPEFVRADYPRVSGFTVAWESANPTENDYITQPPGYGWHVPRGTFDEWLIDEARSAGAIVLRGERVRDVKRAGSHWRVDLRNVGDRAIVSDWLIDATGRFSQLRGFVDRIVVDRQVVVRATYHGAAARAAARPLVEATNAGWWFSIASPGDLLHVLYFSDVDLLPANHRSSQGWRALLEQAALTHARASECECMDGPHVAPARSQYVTGPFPASYLPIGDAVLAFDALAGQGLAFAIESARVACESIIGAASVSSGSSQYAAWLHARIMEYRADWERTYRSARRFENEQYWRRRRCVDRLVHTR